MPHATIKIWPGKTEEQKQLLAERITEVITETLEGKKESVSVSIIEIEPDKWGTEVYKNEIIGPCKKRNCFNLWTDICWRAFSC